MTVGAIENFTLRNIKYTQHPLVSITAINKAGMEISLITPVGGCQADAPHSESLQTPPQSW